MYMHHMLRFGTGGVCARHVTDGFAPATTNKCDASTTSIIRETHVRQRCCKVPLFVHCSQRMHTPLTTVCTLCCARQKTLFLSRPCCLV